MAKYDNNLLVIGGGSAGLIAALIAATVRARVTLIERSEMGGDCLNTGCVPSKALIASAKAAHALSEADRYGIASASGEVDFDRVMARVRNTIQTIAPKDSMERYRSMGVDCVAAEARIADAHVVEVEERRISARRIVLASGAAPFVPPIPGIESVDPLTSDNLWQLRELPRRLLVLGGGPIGLRACTGVCSAGRRGHGGGHGGPAVAT